jgi:hypothetical protein
VQWTNVGNQSKFHPIYDASGVITTGGAAQLVLPQVPSRSHLILQNISGFDMYFEFGSARATATITNGAVSSVTVTNAGFNFSKPPVIIFYGGGAAANGSYLGLDQPGGEAPNSTLGYGRPAKAHCVLTTGAVSSIVIDDPGAGYVIAPFVFIHNSDLDPYGCALPSATNGVFIGLAGGSLVYNGSSCPTDSISVFCATTAAPFTCKWMT